MKVMQLIDSLELGGAERMAVSYANMLSKHIDRSYLCVTRNEGALKKTLAQDVSYHFLDRTKTLDFKAVKRTVAFIQKENIGLIHAHGTSFFFAYLIKRKYKGVKVIWHIHHGASADYGFLKTALIKNCVLSFDGVIVVNAELKNWVQNSLDVPAQKCHYLSNFVEFDNDNSDTKLELPGMAPQRVVCLANLKHPKEHLFLCLAFNEVVKKYPNATLHLVGKDFQDNYSDLLKALIKQNGLEASIFIYGQQDEPKKFLDACDIGVIASSSEGLPMALLEYGKSNLAVVTTDVGECAAVVQDNGLVVGSGDEYAMKMALETLLDNGERTHKLADSFTQSVKEMYSLQAIQSKVLNVYSEING